MSPDHAADPTLVVGVEEPSCVFCLGEWPTPFMAAFRYVTALNDEELSQSEWPAGEDDSSLVGLISTAEGKATAVALCFACGELYKRKREWETP
jgi:hypothetical protein